jgi:hypothetical protein
VGRIADGQRVFIGSGSYHSSGRSMLETDASES